MLAGQTDAVEPDAELGVTGQALHPQDTAEKIANQGMETGRAETMDRKAAVCTMPGLQRPL